MPTNDPRRHFAIKTKPFGRNLDPLPSLRVFVRQAVLVRTSDTRGRPLLDLSRFP